MYLFFNYSSRDLIIQAHGKIRAYGKTGEVVEYFLWEYMPHGITPSDAIARVTRNIWLKLHYSILICLWFLKGQNNLVHFLEKVSFLNI